MEFTMWMVALLASVHALDVDHVRSRRSANDADRANVRCDFDSNTACAYLRPNPSSWIVNSGDTSTPGTGPTSAQSGAYYIYYEASEPGEAVATLSTVSLQGTSEPGCLRFFSHMWDETRSHMGQLEVQVHPVGQSPITMLLLGIESNVNAWIERKVTIWPNMTRPYQIKFIARRGSNFMSDIGLDTIDITPGQCEPRWLEWVNDGLCSVSCGGGKQRQVRTCVPSGCDGPSTREIDCNTQACPTAGGWCPWKDAEQCNKPCGGGSITQVRECRCPAPANLGSECTGIQVQTLSCNTAPCNVDGQWCPWSALSTCSASCGQGIRTQQRTCACPAPSGTGRYCQPDPDNTRSEPCFTVHCPINGEWGAWGVWDACTKTCEGGKSTRRRVCDSPAPQFNGRTCPGEAEDKRDCNPNTCPGLFDCTFESTCAWKSEPPGGFQISYNTTGSDGTGPTTPKIVNGVRDFDDTASVAPGHYIYSDATYLIRDGRTSNDFVSPVRGPGQYCLRFSYHMYGATQGTLQVIIRYRSADPPKVIWTKSGNQGDEWKRVQLSVPLESNARIPGDFQIVLRAIRGTDFQSDIAFDEIYFLEGFCQPPEDGQWSLWSDWTTCTLSCGRGEQSRSRTCDNPPPKNGGELCLGHKSERRDCNDIECPVNGMWSLWTLSGPCEATCAGASKATGTQKRSRTCSNPYPRGTGAYCDTQLSGAEDTVPCEKDCDVNFVWTDWTAWSDCFLENCNGVPSTSSCTVPCGLLGRRSRSRTCIGPINNGLPCPVSSETQDKDCDLPPCYDYGKWTTFAPIPCCGGNVFKQTRECIKFLPPDTKNTYCSNPKAKCFCKKLDNSPVEIGQKEETPIHDPVQTCHPRLPCNPGGGCYEVTQWSAWSLCSKTCNDGSPGTKTRTRTVDNNCSPACSCTDWPQTESAPCAQWACEDPYDCSFCSPTGDIQQCPYMMPLQDNTKCPRTGQPNQCWEIITGATPTAGTGPERASQRSAEIKIQKYIYDHSNRAASKTFAVGMTDNLRCSGLDGQAALSGQFYYIILELEQPKTIVGLNVEVAITMAGFDVFVLNDALTLGIKGQFEKYDKSPICIQSAIFPAGALRANVVNVICTVRSNGQYVVIRNSQQFQLCEIRVATAPNQKDWTNVNLAYKKTATQISDFPSPGTLLSLALNSVDGDTNDKYASGSCSVTNQETNPWWQVNLGSSFIVQKVVIFRRTDALAPDIDSAWVTVGDNSDGTGNNVCGQVASSGPLPQPVLLLCANLLGRYVRVSKTGNGYLNFCEVQVYGTAAGNLDDGEYVNLAYLKPTDRSSEYVDGKGISPHAVDGDTRSNYFLDQTCFHSSSETDPYWRVDLTSISLVTRVVIFRRTDFTGNEINNAIVTVGNNAAGTGNNECGRVASSGTLPQPVSMTCTPPLLGRYVRVTRTGTTIYLNFCEVQVYGTAAVGTAANVRVITQNVPAGETRSVVALPSSCQLATDVQDRGEYLFFLDLGGNFDVRYVQLQTKVAEVLSIYVVFDINNPMLSTATSCYVPASVETFLKAFPCSPGPVRGRYVVIKKMATFELCSAQVFAADVCYAYFESTGTVAPAMSRAYFGDMCLDEQVGREERCMTFQYHLSGSSDGQLEVIIETSIVLLVSSEKKVIWRRRGDQGFNWKGVCLDLGSSALPSLAFRVIFRGTDLEPGDAGDSDIAVDDIKFYDTTCAKIKETNPGFEVEVPPMTPVVLPLSSPAC